jgi:hypothetical protein
VNDSNYLAVQNNQSNSIDIYNLYQKRISKKVVIELEGENTFPPFSSFIIKNLDSIILLSTWPKLIAIANGKGEIIKKLPIDQDMNGKSLRPNEGGYGQRMSLDNNILYLFQQLLFTGYNGIFDSKRQQQSDIALSINFENENVKSLPLKYPKELVNKDIFNMVSTWERGYSGCYVYTSSLLPFFFITEDFKEFRNIPIQTNYKFELPENLITFGNDIPSTYDYVFGKDLFFALMYDNYRECYYFIVKKRSDEKREASNFGVKYPDCFIIILDKEFRHMGDVYFPKDIYYFKNMFITKEGLYISEDHIDNPTYSEDIMRFRLFKLKEIEGK